MTTPMMTTLYLLVDGDYFLSGVTPSSESVIRAGVEKMQEAVRTQLLTMGSDSVTTSAEQRVVFFSSAILKSLGEQQREVLLATLRRLRFQTTVLDSIPTREGSPVDAAICTKTMAILAKAGAATNSRLALPATTFVYFSANAHISSALEWVHSAEQGVCFVVYEGDSVADELLVYVSLTYGRNGGIARIEKGEGVEFLPNAVAASAALAALQHEGKELPLSALLQLKQLQQRVMGVDIGRQGTKTSYVHKSSDDGMAAVASMVAAPPSPDDHPPRVPPPIAGAPNPFEPVARKDVVVASVTSPDKESNDAEREKKHSVVSLVVEDKKDVQQVPIASAPPMASDDARAQDATSDKFPEPEVYTRLPVGWALLYDRQRRRHYFVHTSADRVVETTWTHPGGLEDQVDLERQVENWYKRQQEWCKNRTNSTATGCVSTAGGCVDATTSGWDECVDPRSGRKYYVDRQTRQTSWTLPSGVNTAAAAAAGATTACHTLTPPSVSPSASKVLTLDALPPFWEERLDPKSGRPFYVNHQTRETTWTRPPLTPGLQLQQQQQQPSEPVHMPSRGALPPFWEERLDPKSGRPFYVNHQTRETTWTRP